MPPRCACRTPIAVVVALCLVAAADGAEAQRYRSRVPDGGYARVQVHVIPHGLYVGAGLVGMRILGPRGGDALLEDGGGMTLYTGLRLGPRLALELGWMATFHDPDSGMSSFDPDADYLVWSGFSGDAKIYLGDDGQLLEPYVQGGVGLYLLDSNTFGAQSVGTGFQAGGGLDFHLGPHLDLGLRALYRGVAMGPPDAGDEDTFISALGAEGNLTLRF